MKIGILTHYNVSSHGALLQMYALKKELESLGHEVYILTYNRNMDFIDENTRKRYSASLRNVPYYLRTYLDRNGVGTLVYQYKKQKKLYKFLHEHFQMMPYTESGQLDYVVVGADEVFALENGVNMMMFGHGITSKRIISYAPSCGQTDIDLIDKRGCRWLMQSGLEHFYRLSVRDQGTRKVIYDLIGKNVPIVCDPALLHNFRIKKQITTEKYIVIYSYQSNFKQQERIDAIKKYATERKCKLYSVGVYYKWCDRKIQCDPLEMLNIFANAVGIITDTFHGTISSYIAHTPMAIFMREDNNVKMVNLIASLELESRIVKNPDELGNVMDGIINFNYLDDIVQKMREKGNNYLNDALKI